MNSLSQNISRLIIGAGLVAATALSVYFYLRDEAEAEVEAALMNKAYRRATSSTDKIKVRIRKGAIGAIIGKRGENVRRIQNETNTRITFEEDKTTDSGDKFAVISGDTESIKSAEDVIRRMIAEQPILFEENFEIPFYSVGAVIGRHGEVIKALQKETGCRIDVHRIVPNNSKGNPVTLKGSEQQIKAARIKINEIIEPDNRRPF